LTVVEELGSDANLLFPVRASRISAESLQAQGEDSTLMADEQSLFTARVDPRTSARPGGRLTLAVDPKRFHFFHPDTGESLLAAPHAAPAGERVAEVVLR
jgi:multiple sugar transport system ATP-binding protein